MGKGLLPKRPPISIEWFYPSYYSTASVEERISAMTEFKALHAGHEGILECARNQEYSAESDT